MCPGTTFPAWVLATSATKQETFLKAYSQVRTFFKGKSQDRKSRGPGIKEMDTFHKGFHSIAQVRSQALRSLGSYHHSVRESQLKDKGIDEWPAPTRQCPEGTSLTLGLRMMSPTRPDSKTRALKGQIPTLEFLCAPNWVCLLNNPTWGSVPEQNKAN